VNFPAVALEISRSWSPARLLDYLELTKPKIAVLVLVTVGVGAAVAARGRPDAWLVFHAVLGTALVASSASALNQWLERDTDARMRRTASRPLPAGRLHSAEVLAFGFALVAVGTSYLIWTVNLTTALVGLLTWALYVWVYTPLKTRTTLNTVVGAVPGALPVVMGFTAMGGEFTFEAVILFLIVFLWQFPHFMAIAWIYRHEYAEAGLRMLPSVDRSGRLAPLTAVLHALTLIPVSLAPASVSCHLAGLSYFAGALVLGLGYLAFAIVFLVRSNDANARGLLRASLVYLPALFLLLLLDLLPRV
jgi:protoheme IX farnesyltransferase